MPEEMLATKQDVSIGSALLKLDRFYVQVM